MSTKDSDRKKEKLSYDDMAAQAAIKDMGDKSFLAPPPEKKKADEGKVIRNAKPRSALDKFVGNPTSKEEQELEDLNRSYRSRNRKSATQKFTERDYKGGGAVKKRRDGLAQRGKTKGRMC